MGADEIDNARRIAGAEHLPIRGCYYLAVFPVIWHRDARLGRIEGHSPDETAPVINALQCPVDDAQFDRITFQAAIHSSDEWP